MSFEIIAYREDLAPHFDRLNRWWIEAYFAIEPFDDEVLRRPDRYIIAPGGEIWMAQTLTDSPEVVGVCALMPYQPGILEFTKLGVDPAFHGQGIAKALLHKGLERAKALGFTSLRLFTSSLLKPANRLYVQEGFQEIPCEAATKARYKRCDIVYDYPL